MRNAIHLLSVTAGLTVGGLPGCVGVGAPATKTVKPAAAAIPAAATLGLPHSDGSIVAAKQEELPSPQPAPPALTAAGAAGGPLTLADLERLALAKNPTIAAAAALVRQQLGFMKQAGLYPNPTVGYLRTDADHPGQTQTEGVFVSQDIVTAGKLYLARTEERQYVEWRDWQLKAQQERVRNDVRIRFYEVLGAQEALQVAAEFERLAIQGVQLTEQLRKGGQGSRLDVVQAELQLSAVRSTLQDAQVRQRTAWKQLVNVMGVPDLPPAPLVGTLEEAVPDLDWQTTLQQLYTASPLLHAQEAQLRGFQYDLKLAKAQAFPNVNVQVVAQRDSVQQYSSVSTLLSLPVPIFNRNQGNIQQSIGQLQQQQSEYERIKLALADQLASAFQQYQSARGQTARLRAEILPKSKENLDLTTAVYKQGQTDYLRVLNAQHSYLEARLGYIDALTALHKAVIEIVGLELVGGLNPTEIGTALQTQGGGGPNSRSVLLQQLQQQGPGATGRLPGAIQSGVR